VTAREAQQSRDGTELSGLIILLLNHFIDVHILQPYIDVAQCEIIWRFVLFDISWNAMDRFG
jgi:hypothetical protein